MEVVFSRYCFLCISKGNQSELFTSTMYSSAQNDPNEHASIFSKTATFHSILFNFYYYSWLVGLHS